MVHRRRAALRNSASQQQQQQLLTTTSCRAVRQSVYMHGRRGQITSSLPGGGGGGGGVYRTDQSLSLHTQTQTQRVSEREFGSCDECVAIGNSRLISGARDDEWWSGDPSVLGRLVLYSRFLGLGPIRLGPLGLHSLIVSMSDSKHSEQIIVKS